MSAEARGQLRVQRPPARFAARAALASGVGVDAVHEKADERHAFLREALVEEERLLERLWLRAGHQHEAGALRPQQRVHLGGARPEAIVHALEGQEELGELLQELQAHEAVGDLQQQRRRCASRP